MLPTETFAHCSEKDLLSYLRDIFSLFHLVLLLIEGIILVYLHLIG